MVKSHTWKGACQKFSHNKDQTQVLFISTEAAVFPRVGLVLLKNILSLSLCLLDPVILSDIRKLTIAQFQGDFPCPALTASPSRHCEKDREP